ncbi:hypothetical protein VaNZ11_012156 [Volvox africanus]|uniref:Uncharacterized protein n=1 Tax=Volvox africanus TaxID=51714 RepID=A0ABQ5SEI3_9CHLO|nr:hypothetical protein VaNZ11_012156 [Volvox africanus]
MLHVTDENAVTSNKTAKPGVGDGLCGVKDTLRPGFGKPLSKPAMAKSQSQQKTRTALCDLTNVMKGMPVSSNKLAKSTARAVPELPVEHLAGKGWQVMEEERLQQREAELQQRLDRIAASASTWTTSHLYQEAISLRPGFLQDSSDDETDSDGSFDERFSESPVIVQFLAPRCTQGVTMPQPGSGFNVELYNLLPDVPAIPIDLGFCWTDDEA